jgi:murein DD-endopeptidase MepM/ murein hydrolase activator NlpD
MARRAHVFLLATATSVVVCSSGTGCDDGSYDILTNGESHWEPDPHGDETDAPPPNDDPTIGADGVEPSSGETSSSGGTSSSSGSGAGARAESPVAGKEVTYPYGVKNDRYAAGYHTGEDYATPTGSAAIAVRSGKIAWSNDNGGAYGKWMGLDADNGRTYVYCHLSTRMLAAGATVKAGDPIGKTGATGNVTGPHLHFEDHPLGPFKYGQVRKPTW